MFRFVGGRREGDTLYLDRDKGVFLQFKEAKGIADVNWLNAQLSSGKAEVVSATSFLRGYQGGMLQVIGDYVVFPQRGFDAPSSPGKLDVCAGRTTPEDRSAWRDLVIREGLEEIVSFDGNSLVVPELDEYPAIGDVILGEAEKAGLNTSKTSKAQVEVYWPKKNRIVVREDGNVLEDFEASYVILPELSSVEVLGIVKIAIPGKFIPYDTETFMNGGTVTPVNRNIFVVNYKTGETTIYSRGTQTYSGTLTGALTHTKTKIEAFLKRPVSSEDIVSPKLRFVVENWPVESLGNAEGLNPLNYFRDD
ncbi:MAG: hypothetical protein ABIA93_07180 [Candidatus Woesearchaeota archaeon]